MTTSLSLLRSYQPATHGRELAASLHPAVARAVGLDRRLGPTAVEEAQALQHGIAPGRRTRGIVQRTLRRFGHAPRHRDAIDAGDAPLAEDHVPGHDYRLYVLRLPPT